MDVGLFRADEAWWVGAGYTAPRVVSVFFTPKVSLWVKSLRVYRPSTAMYGKIEGQIHSTFALPGQDERLSNVVVPGTYTSVTFTAGAGATGWINIPLTTPIKLPYVNTGYRILMRFPGGSGNQIGTPRTRPHPYRQYVFTDVSFSWRYEGASKNNTLIEAWWDDGDYAPANRQSVYNDNIPLGQIPTFQQGEWVTSGEYGTQGYYATNSGKDWGIDLVATDTDPFEVPQPGPVYHFWRTGPPHPVSVANYKNSSVTGFDFDATEDCFITHLKVYRPKGFQGEDEHIIYGQNETGNLVNNSNQVIEYAQGPGGSVQVNGPAKILRNEYPYCITSEVWHGGLVGGLYRVNSDGTGTYILGTFVEWFRLQSLYSQSYVGWQSARLETPLKLDAGSRYRVVASWPFSRPATPNYYTASGTGSAPRQVGPIRMVGRSNATGSTLSGAFESKPGSSPDQPKAVYFPTTPTTDAVWNDVIVTTKDPFLSESGGGIGDFREPNALAQRMWYANLIPENVQVGGGEKLCIQEFRVTSPAKAYGLRFLRKSNEISGTVSAGLFIRTPLFTSPYYTVLGTGPMGWQGLTTTDAVPENGEWLYEPFPTGPVNLAPGQTYCIVMHFSNGYPVDPNYFDTDDIDGRTSGVLEIPELYHSYVPRQDNNYLDITVVPWEGTETGDAGSLVPPQGSVRAWESLDLSVPYDPEAAESVGPATMSSILQTMCWCSAMEFSVDLDATGYGLWFYRTGPLVTGQPTARVYVIQENSAVYMTEVVGADVTFDLAGADDTGWVFASFRAPVFLKAQTRYLMAYYWPDGMPTMPNYYTPYGETGTTDRIIDVLRIPCHNNANMGRQSLLGFPSQMGDTIALPNTVTPWHMLVDISVKSGTTGANRKGQYPENAMSLMGTRVPDQAIFLVSQNWFVPGASVSHEVKFDENVTAHGIKWFRYSMQVYALEVAIYRVTDNFLVGSSRQPVPPATMYGWVYIPFPSGISLSSGERYRITIYQQDTMQMGPQQFNAIRKDGLMTAVASYSIAGPIESPVREIEYPRFADGGDFHIDLVYTPGTAYPPAITKTLFKDDHPVTQTIITQAEFGYTLGLRFGTNETVYATALRFYRPRIAVGSGGQVLGALWAGISNPGVLPNSPVIFKVISNLLFPEQNLGWQVVQFPYPVPLYPYVMYTAGVFFPNYAGTTQGYFLPGGPGGYTGAEWKFSERGSLFTAGTAAMDDEKQGMYKRGNKLQFPSDSGKFVLLQDENGNPAGAQWQPTGDNYWVDVVATNVTPDYLQPELPPFPLSYSVYGNNSSQIVMDFRCFDGDVVAGMEFFVSEPCYLHAYKYPRVDPNRQFRDVIAGLYTINSDGTGSQVPNSFGTIRPTTLAMWQFAHLKPAIKLVPGKKYKVVMLFSRAYPGGTTTWYGHQKYDETLARGPLRIPKNADAVGGSTITWEQDIRSFVYPTNPLRIGSSPYDDNAYTSFLLDVVVSEDDPYGTTEITRSLYDRKRPQQLSMKALDSHYDHEDQQVYEAGVTAGLEFQVTGDESYVTEIRYWRESFPTSTVIESAAIFEMTEDPTAQPTPYLADYTYIDNSEGTMVPGTYVEFEFWPQDPQGQDVHALGWVTKFLPIPVKLDPEKTYRLATFFPNMPKQGSIPITYAYWEGGAGGAGVYTDNIVAPNRVNSMGKSQAPYAFLSGSEGQSLDYPMEFTVGNAANHWIDVAVINEAPRFITNQDPVVKVLGVNGRERRGSGLDAGYIAVPLLNAYGVAKGVKEVDGGLVVHELDVVRTSFGGQELVQYELDTRGVGVAISKHVEGGISTYEHLGMQIKFPRARKAVEGEDATVEMGVSGSSYESFRWAPIPREALGESPFTFKPRNIRFLVQTIIDRQWVHMDLPIVNPTITWRLSGPFELTGTLSPPFADIIDLYLDEWAVFVHVEYMGVILGTGILMPWASTWDELSIEAVGVTTYPHGIPYMEIYSKFFPDVMEVVREVWRHVQSFPNSNMKVLLPDGFMGVPLFGQIHHDEETGKLLGWEAFTLNWTDFTDCGSLLDQLAASTPFDYQEVDFWNSTHTDVIHGINFGYPRMGGKREEIRFVQNENIIEAIPISDGSEAYASDIIIKGAGEGPDQVYVWIGAVFWDRLRRVEVITDEQIQSYEVGYGIANAELESRLYTKGITTLVIDAFHLNAPLGSYEVGDDILIDGMQPWVGDFMLWHRITSIEFTAETGTIKLDLARSESFRYGRPREAGA